MLSVSDLLTTATQSEIYQKALEFASKVKLAVTSWEDGDPTKSQFGFLSERLAAMEEVVSGYTNSSFLSTATGEWLRLRAVDNYGYTPREKTYASCPMQLINGGGGYWPFDVGDLIFRHSTTGKTYRNSQLGVLESGIGQTCTFTIVADEPGPESSAGVGEINTLVTQLLDVTCANSEPAVGLDEEAKDSIVANCKGSLKRLSLAGPRGIYAHIATNADLSGVPDVIRATEYNNGNCKTTVYIATASGTATSQMATTVAEAIAEIAQPGGFTVVVEPATAQTLTCTYTLYVYDDISYSDQDILTATNAAINETLASIPIGGSTLNAGHWVIASQIQAAISGVFPEFFFKQTISSPSADVPVASIDTCIIGGAHVGTVVRVERKK